MPLFTIYLSTKTHGSAQLKLKTKTQWSNKLNKISKNNKILAGSFQRKSASKCDPGREKHQFLTVSQISCLVRIQYNQTRTVNCFHKSRPTSAISAMKVLCKNSGLLFANTRTPFSAASTSSCLLLSSHDQEKYLQAQPPGPANLPNPHLSIHIFWFSGTGWTFCKTNKQKTPNPLRPSFSQLTQASISLSCLTSHSFHS